MLKNAIKRVLLIVSINLVGIHFSFADSVTDSLEIQLKIAKGDEKLIILSELVWQYSSYNIVKAEKYALDALNLADKSEDLKIKSQALNDIGIIVFRKGLYQKALDYYLKSYEIRKNLGDKSLIASSLFKIGMTHIELGNYTKALNYTLETLKIFEELKNEPNQAHTMNNIANIYGKLKQFDKAIEYSNKSLALSGKNNDIDIMAISYSNLGDFYERNDQQELSFEYYKKAEKLLIKVNDKANLAGVYNNIGVYYRQKNNSEKGLEYYKKAIVITEEIQDYSNYVLYNQNIANVLIDLKKYKEAENYFLSGLEVAKERGLKLYTRVIYQSLVSLYTKANLPEKAEIAFINYRAISDTLFSQELSANIAEMQTKYETDKKDKEIGLLTKEREIKDLIIEKKNNQRNLLIAVIVFVLLLVYLLYNRYELQQKEILAKEKLKQEQIRLNTQIMAQENERKRIAEELHDGIGQMLSAVKLNVAAIDGNQLQHTKTLETAIKLIDDSCNEIRVISHNMMPSALTKAGLIAAVTDFSEKITNSGKMKVFVMINDVMPNRFSLEIEVNVFRIIQELVNNALKYSEATEIHIQFSLSETGLVVMVEDNGKGFDKSFLAISKGNGWSNIYSRVNLLNAHLEIDTNIGRGTAVMLEVGLPMC